jgi:iron complex transport system ATP-binding protein
VTLRADHVSLIRNQQCILDDVSLSLEQGEVCVLVGPNGAGKSSLLAILAGDIQPDLGTVTLDGIGLRTMSHRALAQRRAVLTQHTLLQFGFLSREVVEMGRTPLADSSREDDELAIERSLAETESLHLAERKYPILSGGEQTRVNLARVLAQEAPIVLLDEPTAALDIRHQHMIMRTARSLAATGGTTLAVLHDLNLAMWYADRIAVMSDGRLAAVGSPWEIADESRLSSVFRVDIRVATHPSRNVPLILTDLGHGE